MVTAYAAFDGALADEIRSFDSQGRRWRTSGSRPVNRHHDEPLDRDAVATELLSTRRYVAVLSASVQCGYQVS